MLAVDVEWGLLFVGILVLILFGGSKIPQLANVPEIGEITSVENGAYMAEFGEVRLQGLAEDFVPVEATATKAS